jgi:hypothetical protein
VHRALDAREATDGRSVSPVRLDFELRRHNDSLNVQQTPGHLSREGRGASSTHVRSRGALTRRGEVAVA